MKLSIVALTCLILGTYAKEVRGGGTSCNCGMPSVSRGRKVEQKGRIIGGKKTNLYPWIVSLVRSDKNHFCGAAIINEKLAITAAHCTYTKTEPLYIIAGTADLSHGGQMVRVEKHVEHPEWDLSDAIDDISLLFLARPLQFGTHVSPICLPSGKVNLDNHTVKIVGWGRTNIDIRPTGVLMEVDLPVISNSACSQWHDLDRPQTQICTRSPGKGACNGDSGGPVVYLDPETNKFTLVGLVSYGDYDCNTRTPTVHTEVSAFLPWIKSVANTEGCHKL